MNGRTWKLVGQEILKDWVKGLILDRFCANDDLAWLCVYLYWAEYTL